MAKATAHYYGSNTYGVPVEVAQSENGKWFARFYEWNGYARCWSKWEEVEAPKYVKRMVNPIHIGDSPEFVDIPESEQHMRVEWGFQYLNLVPGPYRLRLPA